METLIANACGLDVHQASITACIMKQGNQETVKEIKTFGTTTTELESLRDWLVQQEITHVAMESTGVYWKPVFNVISEHFELLLVNARHIKNVPGKKTDVLDSEWICKLLRAGLLKGSFIPQQDIRNLRNLTRYQKQLQHQIQSEKNRIHKLLQEANIKLTSVLSDIFGVTGSKILHDLSKGITDPKKLSKHLDNNKRLVAKKEQAEQALKGCFKSHHQFILKKMLEHISFLEGQIKQIEEEEQEIIKNHDQEHELLQTIPGIKEKSARAIIAEIGSDMRHFPDEKHLSSWAGLCPGNNESAGKKKSCALNKGNKWLKSLLIECAWAAIRKKDHYLRAKYYSLVPRMGKKKALIVIAHKILIACYHILKDKIGYKELGADYLTNDKKEQLVNHYLKKLDKLGYQGHLEVLEEKRALEKQQVA